MRVYITRYIVSSGEIIVRDDAEIARGDGGQTIRVPSSRKWLYFRKGEWFTNFKDAHEDAKKRIAMKIFAIRRQLVKYEEMRITYREETDV